MNASEMTENTDSSVCNAKQYTFISRLNPDKSGYNKLQVFLLCYCEMITISIEAHHAASVARSSPLSLLARILKLPPSPANKTSWLSVMSTKISVKQYMIMCLQDGLARARVSMLRAGVCFAKRPNTEDRPKTLSTSPSTTRSNFFCGVAYCC